MKDLIRRLTDVRSPSGREDSITEAIKKELQRHVDDMRTDNLGNLIAVKKGSSGKKLLLDAHMDEIGFVVSHIDDNGFLRVETVGGVSPYMMLGTRIVFDGGVTGVTGMEAESMKDTIENIKNLDLDVLFIDIGARSKEEAEALVSIGTFGTYEPGFVDAGNRLISKSMDDRIGCAILVQVAKELDKPEDDVYFVFSTQEEVGLVGASVAAFDIMPDLAVAVDVTAGPDTPKGSKRMKFKLGKGPTIKIKDRASISSSFFVDRMTKVAKDHSIPFQYEVLLYGGTNAMGYQLTGRGIRAGTVSVPTRYVHSPHEMVDLDDVLGAVKMLKALAEEGVG